MNLYSKYFYKNSKYMDLLVNNKKVLKNILKYEIKLKVYLKKEINSEPVYDDKYIKSKMKTYNDAAYANFQYNEIPKDNEQYRCLSVILSDSILVNSKKENYSQIVLEDCNYEIKNRKIIDTINEDLKLSESDKSDDESDK